ncbi:MAG: patatin-like phospholipase family protein [Oscillospiraceae bacterium]|nr:patatin-like phospholipase family protein [Oscillospiraceae bacterium]
MKRAIVLAGGGAKGSYHFGFWRAIRELGIDFQIVTGSSVGSLNGALMASGLYENGLEMWNTIKTPDIVETAPTKLSEVIDTEGIAGALKSFLGDLGESAINIKMDPFPLGELIAKYLNEKALRESGIDFGIMCSEYPNMKTHPVTLGEIPYGMLGEYLLASSTVYPSMEPHVIGGKRYVDGGYSDNFPINLALDMGAEDIIGVNLGASGVEAKYETDYPVRVIRPWFDLGPTMEFVPEIAKRNMALGYNDTMRSFGVFDGTCYTFEKGEGAKMQSEFEKYCVDMLIKCGSLPLSEKDDYHKSLAVKGLCEKRKQRIGLMHKNLAVVCAETAAETFFVDPTAVYTSESMGKAILKAFAPFENIEENKMAAVFKSPRPLNYKLNQIGGIDSREIIAYLSKLWLSAAKEETPNRDLRSLCRFIPKEFFASLYISFLKIKGEEE